MGIGLHSGEFSVAGRWEARRFPRCLDAASTKQKRGVRLKLFIKAETSYGLFYWKVKKTTTDFFFPPTDRNQRSCGRGGNVKITKSQKGLKGKACGYSCHEAIFTLKIYDNFEIKMTTGRLLAQSNFIVRKPPITSILLWKIHSIPFWNVKRV